MSYTILLIPFFPLLGSLFLLFLGQKLKRIHTSIIGTGSVCCSFVLCLFLFSSFLAGGNNLADKNFEYYFYPWLEIRSFLLDSLSFVMVLIITVFNPFVFCWLYGFSFFCDGVDYGFLIQVFCWLYERREISFSMASGSFVFGMGRSGIEEEFEPILPFKNNNKVFNPNLTIETQDYFL